jgi:hypothetical protein
MIGKNDCGLLFLCDNGYRQLLIVTKEDTQQFQALAIKQAYFWCRRLSFLSTLPRSTSTCSSHATDHVHDPLGTSGTPIPVTFIQIGYFPAHFQFPKSHFSCLAPGNFVTFDPLGTSGTRHVHHHRCLGHAP